MSRIIAGEAKGRTLVVPKSGTRPTSDRVRESLYSMLDHRVGDWGDVRVLDLYAGSGALALEAMSRGAASATLVDQSAPAIAAIRANAKAVGVTGSVDIIKASASHWVNASTSQDVGYSLVFLDPPYDVENAEVVRLISLLANQAVLASSALVVVERSARGETFEFPEDRFELVITRKYGDTEVKIGLFIG